MLLAASILMLAVVSAVVAFDAWPGGQLDTHVKTLVLDTRAPAIRVSANSSAASATPAPRAGAPGAALSPGVTGGRGVAAPNFTAGGRLPAASVPAPAPALPADPTKPLQPVQDTATPIFDSIANPGTTANQVADGAKAVTDQAGVSVGRVSPDLGSTVTSAGQTTSDTIRQAPLPDHVIPGH